MKACASLATALCVRRVSPIRVNLLSSRAAFPSFSSAEMECSTEMNTRRDAVFTSLRSYIPHAFAQPPRASRSSSWQLEDKMFYSKEVHEHFFNPRNAGAFDLSDPETRKKVGTAVVGKAACGDVIKLQVMVEGGKITDARFKTFGCGSAIASSSYATELIKGKSCEDALRLKNTDIAEYLNLPPVKVHCSLLAEDAVRHAIKDYQKKQALSAEKSAAAAPAAREEPGPNGAAPSSSETSPVPSENMKPPPASAAVAALNRESASTAAAAQS